MYKKLIPIAAAAAAALSINAHAAVDMFLKVEGIDGESQDSTHKGEIDVLAWSWGMSQSGTLHDGSTGGAGKASFQDISLTKYIDKSSVPMMQLVATGKHINQATLIVRKAGETALEYIKITMTDLIVTSASTGGSGGESRLTENISLNFAEFCAEYVEQKADGSAGATSKFCFDIAANAVK